MAKSKNPKHCECGNVRHPGEQTCPNCQELDQHRRKMNEQMGRQIYRENREQRTG